jgi:DNA-binding IclR family transcriptional regulator
MLSDLTILRALHEQAPTPVSARLLAEQYGLPLEDLTTRMRSLVSLHYVDCVSGAQDDAYVLGSQALSIPPAMPETRPAATRLE